MERIVEIPNNVEVVVAAGAVNVKGPKGVCERMFPAKQLSIKKEGSQLKISSHLEKSRGKALVGAYEAHIKNMIAGVQEPYVYKLKVCSVHFPISVKISGQEMSVSNFIGEKTPKKVRLDSKAKVEVEGDVITVISADKELAGQIAGRIEKSTRLSNRDRRIFQDGIFVIEKAGRKI